jgi:L-serine dehydratase
MTGPLDHISVFDLFRIGIGPSSSHTVGPMRAARDFADALQDSPVESVTVELFGSLAATGVGHGTVPAVVLGLAGYDPGTIDPDSIGPLTDRIREENQICLGGREESRITFSPVDGVLLRRGENLPLHPNGIRFTARLATGISVIDECYSIGGGFVVHADEMSPDAEVADGASHHVPYPFADASELLALCARHSLTIDELVRANEETLRTSAEIDQGLDEIWAAMQACVQRGLGQEGVLPGGLRVPRRAKKMHEALQQEFTRVGRRDAMEWIGLYALAVNEENAAGGRVVTAPTNGAAGIIPAVLHYFVSDLPSADSAGVRRFLLTAAAIGTLFKRNASISGAEVGCQGEVGSACAMAAGGMAAVLGGTPEQIENAAEIGIEHNLGLTCDPISGLVQIPCIERNAIASVKAVAAARMSLRGDGEHHVSLDAAIATVRATGADMSHKYKETSLGGLAVNVIEC